MRVLLFANTDWYLYNFRLSLAVELRDAGDEVLLVSPAGAYGEKLQERGFRWMPAPMSRRSLNPLRELRLILWLRRLMQTERIDLVHGFTIKPAIYASIAARWAGVPARVSSVAGLGYMFTSDSALARLLRPAVEILFRYSLAGSGARLIVQNNDDARMFEQARLVDPARIRLIRGSGVDCAAFTPRKQALCSRRLRVLLAARLLWDKGVAEYVEASRLLRAKGIEVDFLLAGDPDPGNPRAIPAESAHEWHDEGLVQWLGHVEAMPELLRSVDVAVLPSYREGLPRSLVEAAACGLPLITTDVPGCREVVTHEVEGLIVPARDAIALAEAISRLHGDPALRERLGTAARDKALSQFEQSGVVQRTQAVYGEVVPAPAPPIRIVHLTVCRSLSAGQRKQLQYETEASRHLPPGAWTSLAIHNGPCVEEFERHIPRPFRPIFLRYLYGWVVARRLSRQYDCLLMRHMTFDPFVFLFAPFIRNRFSVHHAKEVEELCLIRPGATGRIASFVERYTGRFGVRTAVGILGVTREIAEYERSTRAPSKNCCTYPNGVALSTIGVVGDTRLSEEINLVFICGTFTQWHGLDRLVEAVRIADQLPAAITIHLIGKVSSEQREEIRRVGHRQDVFRIHGFLEPQAYEAILARCDVGLGSLAMDRQNLQEGATLKVREMLAVGLPVFSGHRDTALPEHFRYYFSRPTVRLAEICEFAVQMKAVARGEVRAAAEPHIAKLDGMTRVLAWLSSLVTSPSQPAPARVQAGGVELPHNRF